MRRVIGVIFAKLFLCKITVEHRAKKRINFHYIALDGGPSTNFWVAKEINIFKKHSLEQLHQRSCHGLD
jgi:hypothetical protein